MVGVGRLDLLIEVKSLFHPSVKSHDSKLGNSFPLTDAVQLTEFLHHLQSLLSPFTEPMLFSTHSYQLPPVSTSHLNTSGNSQQPMNLPTRTAQDCGGKAE